MTKLRNRGYVDPESLEEASGSNSFPVEKIQAMMRDRKHIEAMVLLAKKCGAPKTAKKLELIAQLKAVEEGLMPYELEQYHSLVRKDLMALAREKYGKKNLDKIFNY